MRREGWLAIVASLMVIACDGDRPPAPTRDAGMRDAGRDLDAGTQIDAGSQDSGVTPDAGAPDAGTGQDAAPLDAGSDASMLADGSIEPVDAAALDAGPIDTPDAGCLLPGGGRDYCLCPLEPACATESECSTNQVCIVDPGCGGTRCDARGHRCGEDTDCASGSTCERGGAFKMCVPSGSACGDRRDCPLGHSCDAGACVDRRITCAEGDDCPFGTFCNVGAAGGPYCAPISGRCATNGACLAGTACRDVDGDGMGECVAPGCTTTAACPADDACGTSPMLVSACTRYGHCRNDGDCASSHECLDLAGDGVRHCVARGGSCVRPSDCPAGSLCAVATPATAPRCFDAPL